MQRSRRLPTIAPAVVRAVALDLWPALLAVILCWPLLTTGGHPLARDLVFAPEQPWTDATLGLGYAAPRAVPLDALVSIANLVADGGILAKLVVPVVLALAGWGVHRALAGLGTVARIAAGGFAVWNPFVVERLALGQWALLAAYAALPWLAAATVRWRRDRRPVDLTSLVLWLALASITPTGGLLGAAVVVVLGRAWLPTSLAAMLQLPWLLAGLLGTAGLTSDPAGVAAFAARAEGPGGAITAVLGLGGIWDGLSVPGTRETWWGTVAAAVTVLVVAAGVPALARYWGRTTTIAVVALALGGLVVALLSSWGPGAELMRQLVGAVPGGGLLRDSQKYAALWAVLVACCVGGTVDRVTAAVRRVGPELAIPAAVVLVALPIGLLPDATRATWPTVTPVDWPASVTGLDATLDEVGAAGPVATLPWRSYRRFRWGSDLTASDPALRLLDRPVVVRDDLAVGELEVEGESEFAAALTDLLAQGPPSEALRETGIAWAVVWRDDPAADELDLTGLELRAESPEVAVYEVVDAVPRDDDTVAAAERGAVVAGHLWAALLVVLAAACRVVGSPRFNGRGRTH